VTGWTHGYGALSPALNFAWEEVAILEQLFPAVPGFDDYKQAVRNITAESNDVLLRIVEDTSYVFSDGRPKIWSADELRAQSRGFTNRLVTMRDAFILRNQNQLLATLETDVHAACA
jgi:anaerobic magnesium-protoporphyrin IX monomethyl ester cyclase